MRVPGFELSRIPELASRIPLIVRREAALVEFDSELTQLARLFDNDPARSRAGGRKPLDTV